LNFFSRFCICVCKFQKKKFHFWITLGITWDMSSCTSEEQVTFHIENCMGCPHFHKWKFKWKFFEVLREIPYTHFSYGLSRAGDSSQVNHMGKSKFFLEFSLVKSLARDTSQVKHLGKSEIFLEFSLVKSLARDTSQVNHLWKSEFFLEFSIKKI